MLARGLSVRDIEDAFKEEPAASVRARVGRLSVRFK
jgi:hypothetical protein